MVHSYSGRIIEERKLRRVSQSTFSQGRVRSFETSQDQILGEGHYADPDSQAIYNEHILSLCHTANLNAWYKIQELGK